MTKQDSALWQASPKRLQSSKLWKFKVLSEAQTGLRFDHYQELHQWSVEQFPAFWGAAADFLGIIWEEDPVEIFVPNSRKSMRDGQWFPGARLSFARNLLALDDHNPAKIISIIEGLQNPVVLSSQALRIQVAQCTAHLQALGVKAGDRVAGICPNSSEAIIAMLATSALGAVWSSCSPDFGSEGILDRFSQIEPSVLFASRSYIYNEKFIDCSETALTVSRRLSSLKGCIMIDPLQTGSIPEPFLGFREALDRYEPGRALQDFKPLATTFDHPLYILFSSGTTGKPKCIVHSVGGTLLQHKKELMLHCDLGDGQRLLYFTTCGWMMWNWMVSALATGADLVLFEGSINRQNFSVLWQALSEYKVTCFGTSPKFLASCIKAGLRPSQDHDLSALETILCTGSPLMPEHFHWVYSAVKADVHLASISGGTDIISCFMLGNPWQPVYAGEIQGAGLGMAVDCWDEAGHSLRGQRGELVCTKPFPSMPIGFWKDDGSKYQDAYFSYYQGPEVWRHGDFIEINARAGITVYGRSDATLNPGGVRIGTAEIYRQVEQFPEVQDSLAVSRQRDGDAELILFVKLQEGLELQQDLVQRIKGQLRHQLSPRHIPAAILQVKDIPYTRSGKKLELAVTRILHEEALDNLSAIMNPECLGEYECWRDKLT
jgi:acetoacetyl-CoA synthetase